MVKREAQPALPPEMYARLFVNHAEGALILEELFQRFGGNPYRKGGLEAQRATDFACGQNDVVNFITSRINAASEAHHDGTDPDPE